ncbi:MAG: sigma-70 family RNA polymerase sigma factor [Nannocystaceae bacterium]|nr:sigma-70 family RNA polymerase sigma factor [Nannocystaceae bacterium]
MAHVSEEELYVQWREGSVTAGNALAAKYCEPVLAFFRTKFAAAAEDLMQQTFLSCLAARVDPRSVRSFRGFLFGIARKHSLRHAEGRGRLRGEILVSHLSLEMLRTTPTQRISREQEQTLIQRAIQELSLDDQIALELYYWQKMSVRDISAVLELSEGGMRAKLHRARSQLKAELAKLQA